jgi:hypothetical protein
MDVAGRGAECAMIDDSSAATLRRLTSTLLPLRMPFCGGGFGCAAAAA